MFALAESSLQHALRSIDVLSVAKVICSLKKLGGWNTHICQNLEASF